MEPAKSEHVITHAPACHSGLRTPLVTRPSPRCCLYIHSALHTAVYPTDQKQNPTPRHTATPHRIRQPARCACAPHWAHMFDRLADTRQLDRRHADDDTRTRTRTHAALTESRVRVRVLPVPPPHGPHAALIHSASTSKPLQYTNKCRSKPTPASPRRTAYGRICLPLTKLPLDALPIRRHLPRCSLTVGVEPRSQTRPCV